MWLSSFRGDADAAPSSKTKRVGSVVTKPPAIRVATHMFYKTGPLQYAVYKGQWRNAVINGNGQLTWPDGRVYEGQFQDGEVTGYV